MLFCYRPYRHNRRKRIRLLTLSLPILALLTLTLPFYLVYKPPHLLISYFASRYPDVLWHVPLKASSSTQQQPMVALTLDDAPSEFTPEILRLLRENEAHATFFLIGDHIPGREHVLRDAVNDGHELGNHAMFDQPSKELSDEELAEQIQAVQSRIQRIYASAGRVVEAHNEVNGAEQGQGFVTGTTTGSSSTQQQQQQTQSQGAGAGTEAEVAGPVRYFRPGSGFFTDRMRALVQRLGFRIVLGSVYPHDAQISVPWVNAAHVLSMVRPGSVIVVHDRRPWTAPMLATVLPELKRRGYRIGTVTELLREGASSGDSSASS
ncbi:hypothetical protein BJX61DRAFT_393573 [Aspergillus egyptiacus]|nr:hypothetical protein BJX61DRAFT_393573 [Aspergillus egyptiacus]